MWAITSTIVGTVLSLEIIDTLFDGARPVLTARLVVTQGQVAIVTSAPVTWTVSAVGPSGRTHTS